jgi:hypothetical protein
MFDEGKATVNFIEVEADWGFSRATIQRDGWRKIIWDVYGQCTRGETVSLCICIDCQENAKSELVAGVGNKQLFDPENRTDNLSMCR